MPKKSVALWASTTGSSPALQDLEGRICHGCVATIVF